MRKRRFGWSCSLISEIEKTRVLGPGILIHEGDGRLTNVEIEKMGLRCPITLISEITKMGMRKPSPPIHEIRNDTDVIKLHVLSFSWDMDRAEEG